MFGYNAACVTYFVLSIVVIIFLMFQLNENFNQCQDVHTRNQDQIIRAAKLIVQSATQSQPLFAYEHALESKFILEEVINQHNGIVLTEKNLKMPKGQLDKLRTQVQTQHQKMQDFIMTEIINVYPQFDTEANNAAGLHTIAEKHHSSKSHGHSRHK
jgi:hypothetical protein